MFHPISFSVFRNNVLDYIGRTDLVTITGKSALIERSGMDFVVSIDRIEVYRGPVNISAAYALNMHEVGINN